MQSIVGQGYHRKIVLASQSIQNIVYKWVHTFSVLCYFLLNSVKCVAVHQKKIFKTVLFLNTETLLMWVFSLIYMGLCIWLKILVLKCLQGWDAVVLDAVAVMANRGLICIFNEAQVLVGPLPNLISLSTSCIPTSCMLICLWKGKWLSQNLYARK